MLAWWKNSLMESPMERLLWLEFFQKPFPGEDYRNSPTCEIHVLHPSKASCYSKCCCIYKGKTCAFVINCFITNYHKHIGLIQSTFMIPQLLGSGVRAWLSWVCSSRVSLKAAVKEKARAVVSSKAQLGKDLWSAGFRNSLAAKLRASEICLLSAGGRLRFLAARVCPCTGLIH